MSAKNAGQKPHLFSISRIASAIAIAVTTTAVYAAQTTPILVSDGNHYQYDDLAISAPGYAGIGVKVTNGSATVSGGTISSGGNYGAGLYATGANAAIDATDLTINAIGSTYNYGVSSENGAKISLKNASVSTTGTRGHAVYANSNSQIELENVDVSTIGSSTIAVRAENKSQLTMNGGSVTTKGTAIYTRTGSHIDADGVSVQLLNPATSALDSAGGSQITFNNGAINLQSTAQTALSLDGSIANLSNTSLTSDAANTGFKLANGSTLMASGVSVVLGENAGAAASTILSLNGSGKSNTVSLTDSTLDAAADGSTGVLAMGGSNSLALTNSRLSTPAGQAIAVQGGRLDATLENSQLMGNIDAAAGAEAYLALNNSSVWQGSSQSLNTLSLTNGSNWTLTTSSAVTDVAVDNATIDLGGDGTQFNRLTAGQFTSNNGHLRINSLLEGDDSSSDTLHITGDYSGHTQVSVNNIGGSGAQTVQGIELIQVAGNVNGTFSQQGRIVAGAYDYFLKEGMQGTTHSWYLSSDTRDVPVDPGDPTDSVNPVVPVHPVNPEDPAGPLNPDEPQKPTEPVAGSGSGVDKSPADRSGSKVVRPEAASYVANMAAASTLFFTTMDDRRNQALPPGSGQPALWLRTAAGHEKSQDSTGQLKTRSNRQLVQLGIGIADLTGKSGDNLHLEVQGGYGQAESHSTSAVTGYRSQGQIQGYSAGVGGLWRSDPQQERGAYVYSWLLYNGFTNTVKSDGLPTVSYRSQGFTASVASGYRQQMMAFSNGSAVNLQPSLQLAWIGVKADKVREANGTRVNSEGTDNLQSRLGVRTSLSRAVGQHQPGSATFQPWVEAAWIHNSKAAGASLDKAPVTRAGTRNIAEVTLGVDARISRQAKLWVNAGQQKGAEGYSNRTATLGASWSF